MISSGINYWSVLVAAAAYMVLGAIWYSSILFGKVWMKGIGKTKEQLNSEFSPLNYVWAIITSILAAYGVARIMSWAGGDSVVDGIKVGLVTGICFVFASMGVNDFFEGRPKSLTFINASYHFVGLIISGIIIGLWR
jgi:hypothetical protein